MTAVAATAPTVPEWHPPPSATPVLLSSPAAAISLRNCAVSPSLLSTMVLTSLDGLSQITTSSVRAMLGGRGLAMVCAYLKPSRTFSSSFNFVDDWSGTQVTQSSIGIHNKHDIMKALAFKKHDRLLNSSCWRSMLGLVNPYLPIRAVWSGDVFAER